MTKKELETAKKFITSNNSFYSDLIHGIVPKADSVIKYELILLYFQLNIKFLRELNLHHLISLLEGQNFVLENEYILYDSNPISLSSLIETIQKIEDYKYKRNSHKVVSLYPQTPSQNDEEIKKYPDCKVISFNRVKREVFSNMTERSIVYERTIIVNPDTLPYIEDVNRNFLELLEDMIKKYLSGTIENYNLNYLKVLYSYLSLYPFTTYLQGKIPVPFANLSLPQNEIGLRKSTYQDEYIKELEKSVKQISHHKMALRHRQSEISFESINGSREITKLEEGILRSDNQLFNYLFELYMIKSSPEIYNENLLKYVVASFIQGNIEINQLFQNPVIRMFYIENNQTKFYCAMRLDTLMNLLSPDKALELIGDVKKLKKEIEV